MSFSSAGPLQLTTVTVPREMMGRRGFELLLRRIQGYERAPRTRSAPPHPSSQGHNGLSHPECDPGNEKSSKALAHRTDGMNT